MPNRNISVSSHCKSFHHQSKSFIFPLSRSVHTLGAFFFFVVVVFFNEHYSVFSVFYLVLTLVQEQPNKNSHLFC